MLVKYLLLFVPVSYYKYINKTHSDTRPWNVLIRGVIL